MEPRKISHVLIGFCALTLAAISCSLASGAIPATPIPTEMPVQLVSPTVAPTDTPESTPTEMAVTLTVNKDSLSIRRGPSIYYDVLAYLLAGETAMASARNQDGSWLYVSIPSDPSAYGWVSALTQYSTTQGDVNSLEVMPVDPAKPAYIRNCTFHPMLIQPANQTINPQFDAPNNKLQFPPGNYSAYDQNQQGHPDVKDVTLGEGDSIDINTDGLGNSYYCP